MNVKQPPPPQKPDTNKSALSDRLAELERRESVTYKVKQAIEGHARYLEYQMELIRTSFGRVAEEDENNDDEDDEYSLRAEEAYLSEDERSIYNDLEELMNSIREQDVQKFLEGETEETVAGTFSEYSEEQNSFDDDYEYSPKEPKQVIQVVTPKKDKVKFPLHKSPKIFKSKDQRNDANLHPSKSKDHLERESTVRWNISEISTVNDISDGTNLLQKNSQDTKLAEEPRVRGESNDHSSYVHNANHHERINSERDEQAVLENLDVLLESLRRLTPEEFLREFDEEDDFFAGGDSTEAKVQRINYLIDLLSSKAEHMYNQGKGLNIIYASGLLAARVHAQRSSLASMLPAWFRVVLQNVKAGKTPEWALSPTVGSASENGQHFMPLCDSDDYHEDDPLLSDLEDFHEDD